LNIIRSLNPRHAVGNARAAGFKIGEKAIIVSGFSETGRVAAAQALGAGACVRKPYVRESLGLAVRRKLDRPAST